MIRKFIHIGLLVLTAFGGKGQTPVTLDSASLEKNIFERVETEASFPGGISAWMQYLQKKLNPNVPVDNGAPIGKYTVFVQFVVDVNGNIKSVTPLTSHGYGMEPEVMRLITSGPKWEPAIQNGRKVNAYRKQPVTFLVQDDDIEITPGDNFVLNTRSENTVNIKVRKVKPEDLSLTITQGTIVATGNGSYAIKANKPGKAIVRIFNSKKGNKEIGAITFEVK